MYSLLLGRNWCLFFFFPQDGKLKGSPTVGKQPILIKPKRKLPLLTFVRRRGTETVALVLYFNSLGARKAPVVGF